VHADAEIPAPFQCGGNQPLRRINFVIAPFGQRGFILGAFEPHLPLASEGEIARFQLLEGCESQLDFGRLQSLQNFLGDGGIEQIATEVDTVFGGQSLLT
jgi:hypothetical protein